MPNPSTFTTVPDAQAEVIRSQGDSRKEWFHAIRAGKVIVMQKRPSLTKRDKELLDGEGMRMRTRYTNANDENGDEVYVWAESHTAPPPDFNDAEPPLPEDDEVPV